MTDTIEQEMQDQEELVKVLILGAPGTSGLGDCVSHPPEKSISRQSNPKFSTSFSDKEVVIPKFNPDVWAQMPEINTRLARSIATYARNTVGLGWRIQAIQPDDEDKTGERQLIVTRQKRKLTQLFNNVRGSQPFLELLFQMKFDEEATGNGYIEVVRNNAGQIESFFHIPSISIRRRVIGKGKDRKVKGFVQIKGDKKVFFKDFGDTTVILADTGEVATGAVPPEKRASEVIHFKIYNPTLFYYGAPRYVSTAPAITGNRMAGLRNANFFENDAVPRMAITVSGGQLSTDSVKSIQEFFQSSAVKGVKNSGKVIVLQAQHSKSSPVISQDNAARIQLEPLTVGVTEDSSFEIYRKSNDDEIREAFGIAQAFFSDNNINKASAGIGREITNTQEFEPDRVSKEFIINHNIVSDFLCDEKEILVEFKFERLKTSDPLEEAKINEINARIGGLTPNDIREKLGKPLYDPKFVWSNLPLSVILNKFGSPQSLSVIPGKQDLAQAQQQIKDTNEKEN